MNIYTINKDVEKFELLEDNEFQKVVHLSLKKGVEIPKHSSPYKVSVIILSGKVEFCSETEKALIENGVVLSLAHNEIHHLNALEDSHLIVIQNK